jgi:hypothetical protein
MSILFLFVDGIGIGSDNDYNPFTAHNWPGISALTNQQKLSSSAEFFSSENHVFKAIDATLGVEGLPQSGTGQATLFSGQNASKLIDKHFGPYPHTGIKHLLMEGSLFQKVQMMGKRPYFINAFPQIFFDRANVRNRWSCSTLMTRSAGLKLNSLDDILHEKAITAEIIQDYWRKHLSLDIPPITVNQAAERVAKISSQNELTLMEYYLTDKAGHEQDMKLAFQAIERLDSFIHHYLRLKPADQTLVLTSDHGNIEDLSVKTHTMNPVPLIVFGPNAGYFSQVESIQDVTPAILDSLK